MVKNTTSAKKVAKVTTLSISSQMDRINEISQNVLLDWQKNVVPMSCDDTTLCKFVIQSVKKYFDKPLDEYVETEWTSKKVWQVVIQKIIKFRNTTRETKNQAKIKQKKVKESFKIKRFYMCLHCWRENRYIYIV